MSKHSLIPSSTVQERLFRAKLRDKRTRDTEIALQERTRIRREINEDALDSVGRLFWKTSSSFRLNCQTFPAQCPHVDIFISERTVKVKVLELRRKTRVRLLSSLLARSCLRLESRDAQSGCVGVQLASSNV